MLCPPRNSRFVPQTDIAATKLTAESYGKLFRFAISHLIKQRDAVGLGP
jgi:hypothetical protein